MEAISRSIESQLHEYNPSRQSNKRKRDSPGMNGRTSRESSPTDHDPRKDQPNMVAPSPYYSQQNGNDGFRIHHEVARIVADADSSSSTAAAALAASMPQLNVPQPTELSFPGTNSGNAGERQVDSSFDTGPESTQQHTEGTPYMNAYPGSNGDHAQNTGGTMPGKLVVGTDEWHKVRKDNHKEVERRRRETINEGINELAKIVPGCDKNKGAILQRGVKYIRTLKENETKNIEKWTLEKMLNDEAIQVLGESVQKLKEELAISRREAERWKKRCEAGGVDVTAEEAAQDAETARGR